MIYFCSPYGKDDGSSSTRPGDFKEIVSELQPGDTLYVSSGLYSYTEQVTIISKGIKNNMVSIIGEEGTVFDFRHQPYGKNSDQNCNGFRLFGEYLYLKNIVICYAGYKGIRSELSNSILENIEVYGCCDSGIQISSGGNNTLIHCISHDNFGYKTTAGLTIYFGYHSDGISDKLHYGAPNTYIDCESYNNTDDGFDFYGRCTEQPTIIKNCKSHHNGKDCIDMSSHPRLEIDKDWFEQFVNGMVVTDYDNNKYTATLDKYPAVGNGNGFKLGGNRRYHCVNLYECQAYDNKLKGFDKNHNYGIINLYQCESRDNKSRNYGDTEDKKGEMNLNGCK